MQREINMKRWRERREEGGREGWGDRKTERDRY